MLTTFRTKIKYTPESSRYLGELASAQRYAYNTAIDIVLKHPNITKFDLYKEWTKIRSETNWISDYPVLIQRPGLARAHDSVKKFHAAQSKYVNYKKEPKINPDTGRLYRSRKRHRSVVSIHDSNAIKFINTNKFLLVGRGCTIETCDPVPSDCVVKTMNIVERTKHIKRNMPLEKKTYTAFITIERDDPPRIDPLPNIIGYDLGLVHVVTTSDGEHYDNPHSERIKEIAQQIVNINSKLSQRKRGSVSWRKLRRSKLRLYSEQNKLCNEFEHTTAKSIAQKGTSIAADGILPKNMMASARRTIENPGKNVAAKRALNCKLALARFGKLRDKIAWECKKIGKYHREVYSKNGSITCCSCEHVDKKSRKSQAEFLCVACYLSLNADHNAACVHANRLRDVLTGVDKTISRPVPGRASLNGKRKSSSAQLAFNFGWN